jgi:hypothetical protein
MSVKITDLDLSEMGHQLLALEAALRQRGYYGESIHASPTDDLAALAAILAIVRPALDACCDEFCDMDQWWEEYEERTHSCGCADRYPAQLPSSGSPPRPRGPRHVRHGRPGDPVVAHAYWPTAAPTDYRHRAMR